jgi:DNA-binding response OmpR family regulator
MSRLKVLVVDDEPSLLKMLQAMFETVGYDVLLASDGETAVRRVAEDKPDVVLLDVMIPVLDGWGVLDLVGRMPKRPKVICFTAKASQRDRIKGWQLGADEYMTKPFDVDRLLGLMAEVVERTSEEQVERRRQALEELGAETS